MNKAIGFGVAGIAIAAVMLASGFYAGRTAAISPTDASQGPSRAAVEQIVRDYLVANPEVMIEVQTALEDKQAARQRETQLSVISDSRDDIYNLATDGVAGNPDGDITLVEFYDYNCGYCKRAFPDVTALIRDNPDLKVVFKEFPILGPDSQRAHQVSLAFKALMPERWTQFHDTLMASGEKASEDNAMALAISLGGDEAALRTKMQDPALMQQVGVTYRLAEQLNITGTPSFVIGDEVVFGAVGRDALQQKISAVREEQSGS